MSCRRFVAWLVLLLGLWAWPGEALAKPTTRLDVTEVVVPQERPGTAREIAIGKRIRNAAHHASRGLDFGTKQRVLVTFEVKELRVDESDGLVRVTCTLVGKLAGGGSARSRLSFGGKPDRRSALEKQVLGMVTEGVVTRLAQLSKARELAAAKAKAEAEAEAEAEADEADEAEGD